MNLPQQLSPLLSALLGNSTFYLFIWLHWALGLSCSIWNLSLQHIDLLAVVCGPSCSLARGILVPWSGIESEFPTLQGGFFTTGPPGKSPKQYFSLGVSSGEAESPTKNGSPWDWIGVSLAQPLPHGASLLHLSCHHGPAGRCFPPKEVVFTSPRTGPGHITHLTSSMWNPVRWVSYKLQVCIYLFLLFLKNLFVLIGG